MKKRILLTGGHGFIGRNIRESFLSDKYEIIAPSKKELNLIDEESVDRFFRKNKIDFVIHSAGKPSHRNAKDRTDIFYCDMLMFLNIFRKSDFFKKMIVLSSGAIYDQRFEIKRAKEEEYESRFPADEHGLFRHVSARLISQSDKVVELRIFGVFGPYEDYSIRFISNAICKSIFDLPITIKQNRAFHYLYIKDLMPIIDFFLKHKTSKRVFNVTPNKTVELLQIAEKINRISGKTLPIKINNKKIGLEYSGNNLRIKREIKGLHFTNIDKAIEELYRWYLENAKNINKKLLKTDK